jgi:hypothetical protein
MICLPCYITNQPLHLDPCRPTHVYLWKTGHSAQKGMYPVPNNSHTRCIPMMAFSKTYVRTRFPADDKHLRKLRGMNTIVTVLFIQNFVHLLTPFATVLSFAPRAISKRSPHTHTSRQPIYYIRVVSMFSFSRTRTQNHLVIPGVSYGSFIPFVASKSTPKKHNTWYSESGGEYRSRNLKS